MERRYFGTDGVRGPYGGALMNEAFVAALGRAAARWARPGGARPSRVLIGRDTRASGEPLALALASGLAAGGASPVSLGVLPTPAVSRAVRLGGAALGAVVTASHNPASDNGVKLFGPDGAKLTDTEEARIEELIVESDAVPALPDGGLGGEAALESYAAAAVRLLPGGSLAGWTVAVDTANGATCASTPTVLQALGAQVAAIGNRPDGHNINAGVGSEHPGLLAGLVRSAGARIGIAHDGDGDRCVLCDERGEVLDGDEILAVLATHALARGELAERTLVVTAQSNLGLDAAVAAAGGRVVRSAVGDRYVAEAMRACGASLGGESSGHVICRDFGPTGDGLVAALRVIRVMLEAKRPLSELRRVLMRFPQAARALRVREKRPLEELPGLAAAVRGVEEGLAGRGRVLVRYSGTEPKLRLLVEGPTDAEVGAAMERLCAAARAELDVV